MKSDQLVHTAPADEIVWNFCVPPSHLKKSTLQLLTIGRICVRGTWQGGLGEYFVAWAPLMQVPKVTNGFNHG